jgi:hypothetical protein
MSCGQIFFLLVASREPKANRGMITFASWLNTAQAPVRGPRGTVRTRGQA